MLYLADTNETTGTDGDGYISPNFEADGLPSEAGVDKDLKSVTYFWVPIVGSNLRARGMTLGTMPEEVMVAPEFQGKGIGTELMNRAISEIKARGIYMISVIYGEEKLRCFYEKFGFCTMLCGQLETSFEQ